MLTEEKKREIISLYDEAVEKMAKAEDLMDSKNAKIATRGDLLLTESLTRQATIVRVLEVIGYDLMIDDEDRAIEIVQKEE